MPLSTASQGIHSDTLVDILPSTEQLPSLLPYTTRSGGQLSYRYYPGTGKETGDLKGSPDDTVFILLHGAAVSSHYMAPMARYLAAHSNIAVVTPDLRGHGPNAEKPGDIDYVGQLEDDLSDLIEHLHTAHSSIKRTSIKRIVIGGHSAGGGLAIRYASSEHAKPIDGVVLLAPFLAYNNTPRAHTVQWIRPDVGRILTIKTLEYLGVKRFGHLPTVHFELPVAFRTGADTQDYTYRMMQNFGSDNYETELGRITTPVLVLMGDRDESFYGKAFEPPIRPIEPTNEFEFMAGVSHLDIVFKTNVAQRIGLWFETQGF